MVLDRILAVFVAATLLLGSAGIHIVQHDQEKCGKKSEVYTLIDLIDASGVDYEAVNDEANKHVSCSCHPSENQDKSFEDIQEDDCCTHHVIILDEKTIISQTDRTDIKALILPFGFVQGHGLDIVGHRFSCQSYRGPPGNLSGPLQIQNSCFRC